MRADVLKIVDEYKDLTNVVILTHNIDFVFLQSVALNHFKKAGNPSLTIFADAHQALHSYAHQAPVLDSIGRRYRVVPVPSQPGFCFHPKAILLSSPARATLLVGSGNLTFGGWRENAECWVRFDTDEDGTGRFAAFYDYLREILNELPMPETIQIGIEEAFDTESKEWASSTADPDGLIGRVGSGPPMIAAIGNTVGPGPFDRLTICSPYFDREGKAMLELAAAFQAESTRLLVQPGRSGLQREAAASAAATVEYRPHDFIRVEDGKDHSAFMHAKLLALEAGDSVDLFVGSANCSRAALTIPGTGNAELMAYVRIGADQFSTDTIGELTPVEAEELEFPQTPVEEEAESSGPLLQILGASYDRGNLEIVYRSSPGVTITGCLVDREAQEFSEISAGRLELTITPPPRSVLIEGEIDDQHVQSQSIWVDHEAVLQSSAGQRNVAGAFHRGVRPDAWSISAWSEIAEVFGRYLKYMPTTIRPPVGPGEEERGRKPIEFTAEDVFTSTYVLDPNYREHLPTSEPERVAGLQGLLLRWFGIEADEDAGKRAPDKPITDGEGEGQFEDEEAVDRIVDPFAKRERPAGRPTEVAPEVDRKRAHRILSAIADALSSPDFLRRRPPSVLGSDLKIAAAMLRSALREEWIDEAHFSDVSMKIWKSLFFVSEEDPVRGWIELRENEAEDPAAFRTGLTDAELTAALVGWYLAVPESTSTIEGAEFQLTAALALGKLPWLWAGEPDEVSRELTTLMALTSERDELSSEEWNDIERRWNSLLGIGHAMYRIHQSLEGSSVADLRQRINQESVKRGELLWQGKAGFCVALEGMRRSDHYNVPVRHIQVKENDREIRASFTVPVRALLTEGIMKDSSPHDAKLKDCLDNFVEDLAIGFSTFG